MGCVGGVSVSYHKGMYSGERTVEGSNDSVSPQLRAGAKKAAGRSSCRTAGEDGSQGY